MDFDTLLQEAKSEVRFSQIFVHFDFAAQSLATVVDLVEELGGIITHLQVLPSDAPHHKIAWFKLTNGDIRSMVVEMSEKGFFEIQGINSRAFR